MTTKTKAKKAKVAKQQPLLKKAKVAKQQPLFDHVILVGVGGTGSHLAGPLIQLLHYHPRGTQDITLIDGDLFEEKNLERQRFRANLVGTNKAQAIADEYDWAQVRVIPRFVDKVLFSQILEDVTVNNRAAKVLIITAVDNHATRNAIISALDDENYTDFTLISPGNGYSKGQTVVYAKKDGEGLVAHPFEKYERLAFPQDAIPGHGCVMEAPDEPQLIVANFGAALATLWTVSGMLHGTGWFKEVHFDAITQKVHPHGVPFKDKEK